MHMNKSTRHSHPAAVDVVRREAKRLHRAATSESLSQSLPVLRRLLSTGTIKGLSLLELHRQSDVVRRKHILQMLAIEAGYIGWEAYKPILADRPADAVEHFDIVRRGAGYPNIWFSSPAEAQRYTAVHGGRAVRVGQQAVVFVEAGPVVQELSS